MSWSCFLCHSGDSACTLSVFVRGMWLVYQHLASAQPLAQASVLAAHLNRDRISPHFSRKQSTLYMCVSVAAWPCLMCASPCYIMIYVDSDV